VKSKKQKQRS